MGRTFFVLVDHALDPGGAFLLEGVGKRGLELREIGAAVAFQAKALGQLDEIRLAVGVGLGEALSIERGLPLADHAQHLIVEDDRDDGQLITDSRAGLVEVHVERAIAREHDYPLVTAQRHLCANGRAVAKAHGAQAAAGDKAAALGVAQVLRRPHLVLAHVGDIHGLGAALVAHFADDLMGHQAGGVGHRVVILCLPLADHGHPVGGASFFLDLGEHGVEDVRRHRR